MKIELRNVKHAAFASQETNCYQATVYLDGVAAFTASNEGHGGCDMFAPLGRGQPYATIQPHLDRIAAYAKTLPVIKYQGFECPESIETLLGDALENHLQLKRLNKLMSRHAVLSEPGRLFTLKIAKADLPPRVPALRAKYPKAQILNLLSSAEALSLYKSHAV